MLILSNSTKLVWDYQECYKPGGITEAAMDAIYLSVTNPSTAEAAVAELKVRIDAASKNENGIINIKGGPWLFELALSIEETDLIPKGSTGDKCMKKIVEILMLE